MAQYIDKDALVLELEKRRNRNSKNKLNIAAALEDNYLLSFLNTIETKDVDLDNDIRTYLTNYFNVYEEGVLQSKKSGLPLSTYDIIEVAEHFYELGLKTQKRK